MNTAIVCGVSGFLLSEVFTLYHIFLRKVKIRQNYLHVEDMLRLREFAVGPQIWLRAPAQ
jgi:hypothetical protein